MPETEDQFVNEYRSDIDKPYYIPTFTEVKDHPMIKKAIEFFTGTLVGRLIAFILLVVVVGIICVTVYGMSKMGLEEWKTLLAILIIPIICAVAIWFTI
jgi:hypothetical protein